MLALTFSSRTNFFRPLFKRAFCSPHDTFLIQRLKAVENLRFSDPKKELERLEANPSIRRRLENIRLACEFKKSTGFNPSLLHEVAYCRSIEILNTVKDTHVVLHHGQTGGSLLSVSILSCELQNLSKSEELLEFETKLRHPICLVEESKSDQNSPFNWFKESLSYENFQKTGITKDQYKSVNWFKKNLSYENFRNYEIKDHDYKADLIACDISLGSIAASESAWSFFLVNSGRDDEIKWQTINQIAEKLIFDVKKREFFLQKFRELDEEITRCVSLINFNRSGTLYSILVPIEDFNSVGYFARPFGIPAEITKPSEILLNQFQNDETSRISGYFQVRLVAKKVCSLNLKIFAFPTRPDEEFKENIQQVRALVKEYF